MKYTEILVEIIDAIENYGGAYSDETIVKVIGEILKREGEL